MNQLIERRALLRAGAFGAAGLGLAGMLPAWAQTGTHGLPHHQHPVLSGEDIRLRVAHSHFAVGGR